MFTFHAEGWKISDRWRNVSDLPVTGLISGEVRSGLTPSKPQRTSSIRDANMEGPKKRVSPQTDDSGYESVELCNGKQVSVRKQPIMLQYNVIIVIH
jgi:hypothetical protein